MPRVPGRESTQKTLKLEVAIVHSFLMPFEQDKPRYAKKVCVIEGCQHRIGNCIDAMQVPAYVGTENLYNVYGLACVCCVEKILK